MTHVFQLRIGADHPTLPGHFPGRPIVPGVVLLDSVLAGAEQWLARPLHLRSLQQAKFTRPLMPDEVATVSLSIVQDELRFEIVREDAPLAQGAFKLAEGSGQ